MAGFTDKSFEKDDPTLLWVSPGGREKAEGTYEDPLNTIARALAEVRPGQTIVLKEGVYPGDVTIEVSGKVEHPIRITSETPGAARIDGACWYLYDVSDVIVTDLTFTNSLRGAIVAVGKCQRNRFAGIRFLDCGTASGTSCTLFFGGALGRCNLVENNVFERTLTPPKPDEVNNDVCVGLMISEGDIESNQLIKDFVVRNNTFKNYSFGILVGTKDIGQGEYGHVVEYNTVSRCSVDGIVVKCGDTTVRGNILSDCSGSGVSVTGRASTVEDNRVVDSMVGIAARGTGHNVQNNCLVRCTENAIVLSRAQAEENSKLATILVEQNTCVDCGTRNQGVGESDAAIVGVQIDVMASCVLRRNIFHGNGRPYGLNEPPREEYESESFRLIRDNVSSGGCEVCEGSKAAAIEFARYAEDNFENNSGYGAQGWNAGPEPIDMRKVTSALDERLYIDSYLDAPEGEIESLINDADPDEIMRRSTFFNPGEDATDE